MLARLDCTVEAGVLTPEERTRSATGTRSDAPACAPTADTERQFNPLQRTPNTGIST
jgi:hypothetical protein